MDRQSEHKQLNTISMTVFVFMCSMASLGVCLAFMFLSFNVRNRHRRYVQKWFINFKHTEWDRQTHRKSYFISHTLIHYPITQNFKSLYAVPACYVMSYACHFLSCHKTDVSCHVMPCPILSCHIMSCHVMSGHAMLCHVMSCHATSCHVTSCHVIPYHVMRHVMSRHALSSFPLT